MLKGLPPLMGPDGLSPVHDAARDRPDVFSGQLAPAAPAFDAAASETLLAAMERSGIDWPSSCRNGTCRTCLGYLQRGEIRYQMEWPGLSAEEKAEGAVLPCVAYPCTDFVLRTESASPL